MKAMGYNKMKISHITVFLLLAALASCSLIKEIQPKAYLNEINKHKKMVIFYYKKGSKNTSEVEDQYEKLVERLAEQGLAEVAYYRIDAGKYKNIAKMHKARFVPRIMVAYRKSVIPLAANYNDIDAMVSWTIKKFSEPYFKVETDEEFSEYLERSPVVFTYFGDSSRRDFASFKEICKLHARTTCLYMSDPVMVGTHSHGSLFSIFTHFDEGRFDWG